MKKRLLSLLLALVMLVGMIPATSLTAFAAKDAYVTSVTGIEVTGDGYYIDSSTNNCHIKDIGALMISGTSKIYPDNSGFNSIYTNESCTTRLKTEPKLGETYYFNVYVRKADTTNNITNSKSNIKISGFYGGKVLSTETTNDGFFYCVCSITYGELTGGVKAVASGVEYDSAKGGYAPNFTTLKAVSTEGKELEHTMVDGKYSYYGAKSGCLYKTNSGTSFSNMLTTEPQEGETYYSYFLLDSIDGNLNIEEDLVDIRIPGYEVEYLASYERDMGFTSLVVYSVTKKASEVYVGGVGMNDGDYLAVGATATQTTKPSGGYAYYKDGKLTLNNYSYEGKGYLYNSSKVYYAVIYSKNDLTLELIGNNTLTQTKFYFDMIYVDGANLTVGGDGKLTGTAEGYALFADKDITINGGTVEVSAYSTSILSYGDVIINGGDIVAKSADRMGIHGSDNITINGGDVTAIGGHKAIHYDLSGSLTVAEGMKIQASTTADGELGEYVSANRDSYKKITIHSHNFGTAWKYKESDGHAHVCSFCGEHDTVIKHTPNISAPTETQDQKCTVCGYVIAPSLGHIHKNNLTKVTAKPASCTLDGNSEYYSCSCGKYFKDASASTEIKDKNSVIIKASHSFGTDWGYQDENGHAHACVCGTHDELIPHTPGAEATETTPQKCTECAYIITPAFNHVHNLTKISAKPATCTEEGNAEFYICDGCSDWFEDAEGNVKIEDKASVKFIATGHAFGDEFKTDENEHWYECACGEKKDVAAHNDENDDGKCDTCGYSSVSAETTPSDKTDDENNGGMPWWGILLIVIAVAGISVGVTVIVLKKKK